MGTFIAFLFMFGLIATMGGAIAHYAEAKVPGYVNGICYTIGAVCIFILMMISSIGGAVLVEGEKTNCRYSSELTDMMFIENQSFIFIPAYDTGVYYKVTVEQKEIKYE